MITTRQAAEKEHRHIRNIYISEGRRRRIHQQQDQDKQKKEEKKPE